jgi:hypothetical protein
LSRLRLFFSSRRKAARALAVRHHFDNFMLFMPPLERPDRSRVQFFIERSRMLGGQTGMNNTKKNEKVAAPETRRDETVADFKARLAIMIRKAMTGESYSVIGAAPSSEEVTR